MRNKYEVKYITNSDGSKATQVESDSQVVVLQGILERKQAIEKAKEWGV